MNIKKKSLIYLFAVEGVLFQFIIAIIMLGNMIYGSNLGATDTQLGLVQAIPNLVAIIFMIPIGVLAERCKSTKTMPIILLCIMGVAYIGYASVPNMPGNKMVWFFIFLGISLGFLSIYNAQWQLFFGSVVEGNHRNHIYALRNKFMYFVGAVVPLLCGVLMAAVKGVDGKVGILRSFFYVCAISLFIQAVLIRMVPGGNKEEATLKINSGQMTGVTNAFKRIIADKKLRMFFASMLFFYATWQLDWSMWYIGQVQYIGMSEAQLGYYNALASIFQMLTIGFFARMNVRKGIHKTLLVMIAGLIAFPLTMAAAMILPSDIRAWSFMLTCVVLAIPQGCVNLCVIQLVLNAIPKEGQSVMLSIYTLMITLSNCIFPLLGVRLYILLGADLRALLLFLGFEAIIRIISFIVLRKTIQ